MTRPLRGALTCCLAGLALLVAACGSASFRVGGARAALPARLSLATATTTSGGTWAIAVSGSSAAKHESFWQLLVRVAASRTWRLATPPAVATNGGLIAASTGSTSLTVAFGPSQGLVFTPLASSTNLGGSWSAGVLDASLATAPGALAADPATGHLLALLANRTVELSTDEGVTWKRLATLRAVNATGPGRRCRLEGLSAVAFSSAGDPLLAGTCARAGVVGILTLVGGTWQAAGLALPAAVADQPVTAVAIAGTAGHVVALLQAGTGSASTLTAAWPTSRPGVGNGGWRFSAPLPLRGKRVLSASSGLAGAVGVVMSGRAGFVLSGAGAVWRMLPELPPATQVLALGPASTVQAIAPAGAIITVWAGSPAQAQGSWSRVQKVAVPVQYGSSG